MTRPKPIPPPPPSLKTHSSLSIATNLLLRCEHFFRSLAFLEHANAEDPAQTLRQIYSLCRDFHETLFIIDQTLYRHRMQYSSSNSKAQRKRRGHHHHHHHHHEGQQKDCKEEEWEEDDDEGYRVLSEVTEQLTDYAFLAGNRIHPWDVPYSIISSSETPSSSSKTTAAAAANSMSDNPIKFPPATWKNRELRQTTTPLAGFPLEDRSLNEN